MNHWHGAFEKSALEAHHEFLLSLGIPEQAALENRKWSKKFKNPEKERPGNEERTRMIDIREETGEDIPAVRIIHRAGL